MKNTLTKVLSLILTACFIMSLCVCTTAMAADESIAEKTLKYFDDENWTIDESITAGYTQKLDYPNDISLYWNNLQVSKADKVTAVLGKSEEDSSLHIYTNGKTGGNREFGANLFECANASTVPDNISSGDIFTAYVDLAADAIPAGLGYFGMRVLGRNNLNNASSNYKDIFSINNDGDGTYSITVGDKSFDYTLSTWVNIAVEIEFTNENTMVRRTYVNGNLLGTADATTLAGLTHIRIGFQKGSGMNADDNPSLYIDNVAFYKGAFSQNRYNAIEAASALSVSDIIGNNADLNNIESNLNLITEKNNSTISWASTNETVISTEGVVTPSATEDTEVTLTATVTNGTASETKAYTVTVPKNELITFDEIKGKNLYEGSIVSNLVLPAKLRNETAIYWTSSDENVIATDGSVTRNNDASHSVKLTANKVSDNSVVKEFNLYVIGDAILNDGMNDVSNIISSENLTTKADNTWRFNGIGPIDGTKSVYAIYNAAPGALIQVDINKCTTSNRNVQIFYSTTGTNEEDFADNSVAISRTLNTEPMEFAQVGGWYKDVWNTTAALPAGTRYIKIYSGSLNGSVIQNVEITNNTEDDVTFADIANGNIGADAIMTNLDLSSLESVKSSDATIIAESGTVTRPEKDTVVTLTAKINNEKVTATKIFTLTVLGTKEEAKSEKPWILYNGEKLALISNSTLAKEGKIEFDANVFYAGNDAKTATGIIAIFGADGKLLEIKTVDLALSASAEKQRVSTELTLTKETADYSKATVRGFIWEKGTLKPIGEKNAYTAK